MEKVEAAAQLIQASDIDLSVEKAPVVLRQFLKRHPAERERFEFVLSAVDTYEARREIASELPRTILNAGTTTRDFTISRHGFADGYACLACLYPARRQDAAEEAVQSRELGLPRSEVTELRRSRAGLTERQLRRVAGSRGEPSDKYLGYLGEPLQSFYNKKFCAKAQIATSRGEAVAPLAFGSAWAGFLLAQALMREMDECRHFRIDTMTGLAHPYRGAKRQRDSCPLCGQQAYRAGHSARWST